MIFNFRDTKDAKTLDGHEPSYFAPLSRVMPQKMPSGTDLNTCVKTGVYYFGGLATDYTNTPNDTAHNGVMIVNTFNENTTGMERTTQLYFSPNQNKFYFRTALGSVTEWKPWQEVFTTSGGTVATDGTTPLRLKNNTADCLFLQMQGKSGVLGYFAMNGVNKPTFITADSTPYDFLHTGNMASHVLPLTGGTIAAASASGLRIKNTAGTSEWLQLEGKDGILGRIGFDKVDNLMVTNGAVTKAYVVHHDGNSAKTVISNTAPSDTTALWIDTSA